MAEQAKKVVFATDETTIHLLLSKDKAQDVFGQETYSTESQVLLPGQYVEQELVPPYLLDAVKAGTVPSLELTTEKRAKDISEKAAAIRAMANQSVNVQGPASEGDAMSESVKAASQSSEED